MTAAELLLATAIAAVAGTVQGSVGFGYALLAAPLLGLVDPHLVPGPVVAASLPLSIAVALRERGDIDTAGLGYALAGRVPGTALGAVAVAVLPAAAASAAFAGLVLVAVALSMVGWHVRPTPPTLATAGAASGLMGTMTSIGGPPVALVYQHAAGPRLRATLALYFVVGALMSLTGLALAGALGRRELALALALVPGTALGFGLSHLATVHLDRGRTRAAVLTVSSLAAVGVLVKTLA